MTIINFTDEKLKREVRNDKASDAKLVWPYALVPGLNPGTWAHDPDWLMTPIELALNSFLALPIKDRVSLMDWFVANRVTEPEPE